MNIFALALVAMVQQTPPNLNFPPIILPTSTYSYNQMGSLSYEGLTYPLTPQNVEALSKVEQAEGRCGREKIYDYLLSPAEAQNDITMRCQSGIINAESQLSVPWEPYQRMFGLTPQ